MIWIFFLEEVLLYFILVCEIIDVNETVVAERFTLLHAFVLDFCVVESSEKLSFLKTSVKVVEHLWKVPDYRLVN